MAYSRIPGKGKMVYSGVDIRHPPDLLPPGRAPLLLNISPDVQQGRLQARNVLSFLSMALGNVYNVHSLKRLNDNVPEAAFPWQYFVGVDEFVKYFNTVGTRPYVMHDLDLGFSRNPLAMVPYRPSQDPEPWLYVYDSAKQAKYKTDGSIANIGIAVPGTEPRIALAPGPAYKVIVDAADPTGWTVTGDAAATSTQTRFSTTATAVIYDQGSTGNCSVSLSSGANIGIGTRVNIGGQITTVEQVYTPFTSTTVQGISYDTGTTGACTIQPVAQIQSLVKNQILTVGGQAVTVDSVTAGPDGSYSFRCILPASVAAGAAIVSFPGFRTYLAVNVPSGASVTGSTPQSVLTFSTGVGQISKASLSLDLTQVSGTPITTEDYMHVGFWTNQPQNITEVHVMLDVDSTTNDFTHNYYYYVIRQGDFQGLATGALGTVASELQAITNDIAGSLSSQLATPNAITPAYPTPPPPQFSPPEGDQLVVGNSTWFEATFHIQDLTRVGADLSVSLANVKAVAIQVFFTNTAGSTTNVRFGSWWVGGGYGPDANYNSYGNQGQPILYRYRYRSSATGAISDVSPASRNGLLPRRQAISVTLAGSPDPQVDTIDVERFGGTFIGWHRVAAVANAVGNVTYTDAVTEARAEAGDPLELKQYQPWPVTDVQHTGICNIVGTRIVWVSGDEFNTSWIRGVEVLVNNQTYTLHAPPMSTVQMDSEDNIGVFSNVPFIVPEATIPGTPLPCAWKNQDGRIFSCGDVLNPGYLYFSNLDNPDTAADDGYIEVTDPSDGLVNGCNYEGADYIWTSQSLYRVESTPGGVNPYAAYRLGLVQSGLAARWAFTSVRGCPYLPYLGQDGVYLYNPAGQSINITWEELYAIFPHESAQGVGVAIGASGFVFSPPAYNNPNVLRIGYADSQIFFDYGALDGNRYTLVYSLVSKGWVIYSYNNAGAGVGNLPYWGPTFHYQEEGVQNPVTLAGGTEGAVYEILGGGSFDGSALASAVSISCKVMTPADDQGDSRALKEYGDIMLDFSGTVKTSVYYNNLTLLGTGSTTISSVPRAQLPIPLALDEGSLYTNVGLLLEWTADQHTTLFEWQPSFVVTPELTQFRSSYWSNGGYAGRKYVRGVLITADTKGVARSARVQVDGQVGNSQLGQLITGIVHNGKQALPYPLTPFTGHLLRLVPQDQSTWQLWDDETVWICDNYPELSAIQTPWQRAEPGRDGLSWVQGIRLTADTANLPQDIQVLGDGGAVRTVISKAVHNGQDTITYTWTPFFAHDLALLPLGPVAIWHPDALDWISEPVPELAVNWVTPATSFGLQGYVMARDCQFASANGTGKLYITVDGATYGPFVVGSTVLAEQKQYLVLPPLKGKLYQFSAIGDGPGIQIYQQDLEIRVKQWGSTGPWQTVRPFGDISYMKGAEV